MAGWIVIPNWRRFQHYKRRSPIWIKVYTELLSDDAFLDLTFHQRGVLLSIWLEYARGHRQVRGDTAAMSRRFGERVTTATLKALNDAGFIEFSASKSLCQNFVLEIEESADSSDNGHEPPRDPEALARITALAAEVGRSR